MQHTHLYNLVLMCAYASLYIALSLDIWAIWRLAYAAYICMYMRSDEQ